MESVRQYGYVNAKVRAMRSTFLPETAYRSMLAFKETREIFSFLSQTRYRGMVNGIENKTPEALEQALFREEIRQMRAIQKISKAGTKDILTLLLERYDGERLKTILRAWHSGGKETKAVIHDEIVHPFHEDALLSSRNLEEFAERLEGTPFQKVVMDRTALVDEKKTLFFIEVAIDQTVCERLWKASDSLSRTDRNILRKLVGIEIDLKNLDWILRFRNYYNMPMAEIGELLLPNGWRLGTYGIKKILAGGTVSEALLDIGRGSPVPFSRDGEEALSLSALERFLYQMLFIEAKKAFMAFPLSIGAILGYVTLMRIESRNIRTLVHAKAYGMPAQQIEPFLIM
jgi:vacuolar-type H+-ATPase subunit C/Vma6